MKCYNLTAILIYRHFPCPSSVEKIQEKLTVDTRVHVYIKKYIELIIFKQLFETKVELRFDILCINNRRNVWFYAINTIYNNSDIDKFNFRTSDSLYQSFR